MGEKSQRADTDCGGDLALFTPLGRTSLGRRTLPKPVSCDDMAASVVTLAGSVLKLRIVNLSSSTISFEVCGSNINRRDGAVVDCWTCFYAKKKGCDCGCHVNKATTGIMELRALEKVVRASLNAAERLPPNLDLGFPGIMA